MRKFSDLYCESFTIRAIVVGVYEVDLASKRSYTECSLTDEQVIHTLEGFHSIIRNEGLRMRRWHGTSTPVLCEDTAVSLTADPRIYRL